MTTQYNQAFRNTRFQKILAIKITIKTEVTTQVRIIQRDIG